MLNNGKERVALVTGGTGGIGREVARGLAERGTRVTIVGRTADKGRRAESELRAATGNQQIEFVRADLSLTREVRRVARQFREGHDRLDLLVNSAGTIHLKFDRTEEGLESNIASSYLGRFLITNLLLDLLKRGVPSRVITIAGSRGKGTVDPTHFTNPRYGGMRAHGQAQAANDMFTLELAERLEGSGVETVALNPGNVDTDILREVPKWVLGGMKLVFGRGLKTPAEGAVLPLRLATEATNVNGKLFKPPFTEIPISDSMGDAGKRRRLWEVSARVTGLPEQEIPENGPAVAKSREGEEVA